MTEMDKIRWLRTSTEAPYPACKEALLATAGDRDAALEWLYEHGLAGKPRGGEYTSSADASGVMSSVTFHAVGASQPRVPWWKRLWTR